MTTVQERPNLAQLRPYQAAFASDVLHNLSANESCLGASPLALEAGRRAIEGVDRYPDGGCTQLREAIADRYGHDVDRIVCGAGSEELISLVVQAYAAPEDEVLFSQFGFIKYELAARAYGACPVRARERNYTADVDALLSAVTPRTRVVFLANPNNPTGTYVCSDEVARLRSGLRDDILLVIDAAYAEFVDRADYSDGSLLATHTANTIALRTFSKIHGLAGLRCGWGLADQAIVATLNKVRGAFNVGAVTQAAATAAISDREHERHAREHNSYWLPWLAKKLAESGFHVIPSVCNFLVVLHDDADACQRTGARLARDGILAMPLAGYGLPEAIRITVGSEEANRAVIGAITKEGR